jgi:methylenetetrahydrofolate reductase (NADPH)
LNEDEITVGLAELQDHGIDTVMLLGGDVPDSEVGQYKSSSDVLHSGLLERAGVKKVLFGGHPDGNKLNPGHDGSDWDVLITKLEDTERKGFETGVVTQVSYDPSTIISWEKQFREREQLSDILSTRDIKVPLEIGVLGPADLKKKFELAQICGINTPVDIARKVNLKKAVGLAMFTKPDAMITDLANHISADSTRLRFSTVAQIQDTLCNYVKPIQEGDFSIGKNWLGQSRYDIDPA